MHFTALLAAFSTVFAAADTAGSAGSPNSDTHLDLALDLAKEQGSTLVARDASDIFGENAALEKRGFLLLAKLKYLWAAKMAAYNVCYQCGGNICGSSCCSCGSSCQYRCSDC